MKTQIDKDKLVIYETDLERLRKRQSRIGALAFFGLLAAFAVYNAYSGHTGPNITIITSSMFGFVILVLLIVLLVSPPKRYRSKNSEECLIADTQGVAIANPGMIPTNYVWSEIEKILLTKELAYYGHIHSEWFVIIVYFKKRIAAGPRDRLYEDVHTSPEGFDVRFAHFPEEEMKSIKDAIFRLSSRTVPVESFSKIIFRSGKHTEDYLP